MQSSEPFYTFLHFEYMEIERTMCRGTCPYYTVRINADGTVKWNGKGYVRYNGQTEWKIDQKKIIRLAYLLAEFDFLSYEHIEDGGVLDVGEHKLLVKYPAHDDKEVWSTLYYNESRQLEKLMDEIEEAAGVKPYVHDEYSLFSFEKDPSFMKADTYNMHLVLARSEEEAWRLLPLKEHDEQSDLDAKSIRDRHWRCTKVCDVPHYRARTYSYLVTSSITFNGFTGSWPKRTFEQYSEFVQKCEAMINNSTVRFSNRVDDYIRYRPSYPKEVIDHLHDKLGLTEKFVIADVGSGTGISAQLFLDNRNKVWAIEPNREMRKAAERILSRYANFNSVDGTAENIPLEDHSVDMIIACQAFHWFDIEKSRKEFSRVLKPGGYVVLMWNDRKTDNDEFAREYEAQLNTLEDYRKVNHKNVDRPAFDAFFGKDNYEIHIVPNHQEFDWDGVKGRLMSSSYVPAQGESTHEGFMMRMRRIFDKHNVNGKIRMEYDTKLVYGPLQV